MLHLAPHNQIDHVIVLPDNVIAAYSEPHRFYHDIDHLHYMINRLMAFFPHLTKEMSDAILWAIFYHDIVYHIPGQTVSNEDQSADLFLYNHIENPLSFVIARAIRCTRTHILDEQWNNGTPFWTIVSHLIDLDLWALSDEEAYLQNNEKIKRENNATDEQWIEGRSKWLEGFLERDRIYYTELGQSREAEARRILEADLASLGRG